MQSPAEISTTFFSNYSFVSNMIAEHLKASTVFSLSCSPVSNFMCKNIFFMLIWQYCQFLNLYLSALKCFTEHFVFFHPSVFSLIARVSSFLVPRSKTGKHLFNFLDSKMELLSSLRIKLIINFWQGDCCSATIQTAFWHLQNIKLIFSAAKICQYTRENCRFHLC